MSLCGLSLPCGLLVIAIVACVCSGEYFGRPIGSLKTHDHDVSGKLYVVNYTHIFIQRFNYDGKAPDAFFWVGRKGVSSPTPSGNGIPLANEYGQKSVLQKYVNKNILLTLPADINVDDISWFSVWCRDVGANFGDLIMPDDIYVPNPIPIGELSRLAHQVRSGQLIIESDRSFLINNLYYDGYGPDAFFIMGNGTIQEKRYMKIPNEKGSLNKLSRYNGESIRIQVPDGTSIIGHDYLAMYCIRYTENFGSVTIPAASVLNVPAYFTPVVAPILDWDSTLENCENVNPKLNIGWEVQGDDIVVELISRTEEGQYVAFGLSGDPTTTAMTGADVTVAYIDAAQPVVVDYFLTDYSQCSNGDGACPDTDRGGQNNAWLIKGSRTNGLTKVTYRRRLSTGDSNDRIYRTNAALSIVWAIGKLNPEKLVTKHDIRITGTTKWTFDRNPTKSCRALDSSASTVAPPTPWRMNHISGKETKTFRFLIGPTGGARGYTGITGQVSWGIVFYVNGELIPELTLRRGEKYTFLVEGGDKTSNPARYHPVYVTNDPVGGYIQYNATTKQSIGVYAGLSGGVPASGSLGRYCEYQEKVPVNPEDYPTFSSYAQNLHVVCDPGSAVGEFTFTPDQSTPDLVYYQCYTHKRLGWKIHIVDDFPDVPTPEGPKNCETLDARLDVAWTVNQTHLNLQMRGTIADDEYMAFGLSGSESGFSMINSDVVVATYDDTTGPAANDYFLTSKSLCSNGQGACPDTDLSGTDNVVLVGGKRANGVTEVSISRLLDTGDSRDIVIPAGPRSIVWAIGKLNNQRQPTYHSLRIQSVKMIEFGRTPEYNCAPEPPPAPVVGWATNEIDGLIVNRFVIRVGPDGGEKGYSFMTGQKSNGLVFYINDVLAPEITLERGRMYMFETQAGDDPNTPNNYNPFYLTNSPVGGYGEKSSAQRQAETFYLGIGMDGNPSPYAVGKYCHYVAPAQDTVASSATFQDYFRTLTLNCPNAGSSGVMTWRPDSNTPDLLYYQSYTQAHYGWKIRIVDPVSIPEPESTEMSIGGQGTNLYNISLTLFLLLLVLLL